MTIYKLSETDIYEFAAWLTTRKGVMTVGSTSEAGPMAEAVGEYIKTFPERFSPSEEPPMLTSHMTRCAVIDHAALGQQVLLTPGPGGAVTFMPHGKEHLEAQPEPQGNIPGLAADPSAFVRWAVAEGYDMTSHPLHFLFLNERTAAARKGWNAARDLYAAAPKQPEPRKAEHEERGWQPK